MPTADSRSNQVYTLLFEFKSLTWLLLSSITRRLVLEMFNLAVRLGLKRLSGVVWVSQRFLAGLPKGRAWRPGIFRAPSRAYHVPASSGPTGKASDYQSLFLD